MFPITTSYTDARKNLATLLDRVEQENAIALITRRGHQDIAILPAQELIALTESLHLLRSPSIAFETVLKIDRSYIVIQIANSLKFDLYPSNIDRKQSLVSPSN